MIVEVETASALVLEFETAETRVIELGPIVWSSSSGTAQSRVSTIAATPLSGHRIIWVSNQAYADLADVSMAGQLIGLTENGANPGEEVSVLLDGLLSEPSWSWTPNAPLYLAANGFLSHAPPALGLWWQVGHAISETTIYFKPGLYVTRT